MKPVELYATGSPRLPCRGAEPARGGAALRHPSATRCARCCAFAVPPGYRRTKPPARPKLDAFTAVIDAILEADRTAPPKQRHTAKRIWQRLRDEHGFAGGYTTVKDYVRERRLRTREVFVPLAHPPGHAQVDFGEALAVIGGERRKVHLFCLDLPHSDACFVKAYPAERIEAFLDGHVAAFAFLGGVPRSILYDNTRLAVARILGAGERVRTRAFTELQSHYLFLDRFGRPGKGNDKGKVEGLVGYARRNSWSRSRRARLRRAQRAARAALPRPARGSAPRPRREHRRAAGTRPGRPAAAAAGALRRLRPPAGAGLRASLVRYERNDYSVPTAYAHRPVLVHGYVGEVVIACGAEVIARHERSFAAVRWA